LKLFYQFFHAGQCPRNYLLALKRLFATAQMTREI